MPGNCWSSVDSIIVLRREAWKGNEMQPRSERAPDLEEGRMMTMAQVLLKVCRLIDIVLRVKEAC